jgi:hypothetical protein
MTDVIIKTPAPTHQVQIFLAGDLFVIREGCRRFCLEGLCVTVQYADFVYTYGMESGACVGLTNYPRFPSTPTELNDVAIRLAEHLMDHAVQRSALVVAPNDTVWLHREEKANP